MAIRRKPTPKSTPHSASTRPTESVIGAVIARGGATAKPARTKPQLVQLRLAPGDIERIDASRDTRLVAPSRHAWLLEAIFEKLQREESS